MTDKISYGDFNLSTESLKELIESVTQNIPLLAITSMVGLTFGVLFFYYKYQSIRPTNLPSPAPTTATRPTIQQRITNSTFSGGSVVQRVDNRRGTDGHNPLHTQEIDHVKAVDTGIYQR